MDWPWAKYREHECPDGTRRFVFKNIDHVFPYYFKEAKASTNAAISGIRNIKGKVDAKYEEKIAHIMFKIDEKNGSVQSHLRAAYVIYMSSPCQKLDYLEAAIEAIRQDERNLRSAEVAIRNLDLLLANPASRGKDSEVISKIAAHLDGALSALESRASTVALIEQMGHVARQAAEWQQK